MLALTSAGSAQSWSVLDRESGSELPELTPISDNFDIVAPLERAVEFALAYPLIPYERSAVTAKYRTPEDLLGFVRTNIAIVDYAGSLRSPDQVLAAGAGNVQDTAELLLSLIEDLGYEARLAHAPLPNNTDWLVEPDRCWVERDDGNPLYLARLDDQAQYRMRVRASKDFDKISFALTASNAGINLPASAPAYPDEHTWVQVRSSGDWMDLDPFAKSGATSMVAPVRLSKGEHEAHVVKIEVRAETLTQRGPKETVLLSHRAAARELADQRVQLVFAPGQGGFGGILADALGSAVDTIPKIKPVLHLGSERVEGKEIAVPGIGTTSDGLGQSADPVTAIYLDVETQMPDRKARSERRALIDLLPPPARNSARFNVADIMVAKQGRRYPEALEALRTLIVSNGGLDPSVAALLNALTALDVPEALATEEPLDPQTVMARAWGDAFAISAASEGLARLQSGAENCVFVATPRVFLFTLGETGGDVFSSVDWMIDEVDVRLSQAGKKSRSGDARIWYGVLQSALETTIAEVIGLVAGERTDSTSIRIDQGVTVMAEPNNAPMMLRADQDNGFTIVSSTEAMPAAWWRIHPRTGQTDARLAAVGNASSVQAVYDLGKGQLSADYRKGMFDDGLRRSTMNRAWDPRTDLGRKIDEMRSKLRQRSDKIKRKVQLKRDIARWERNRASGGGNEYLVILDNISLPAAILGGGIAGMSVTALYFYAITGEKIE